MKVQPIPLCLFLAVSAMGLSAHRLVAQEHDRHARAQPKTNLTKNQDLAREIRELRDKVARVEARARELGWIAPKAMGMGMGKGKGMGMGANKAKGMGTRSKTGTLGKTGTMAKTGTANKMGTMGKMGRMAKMGAMDRKGAMGRMGMGKMAMSKPKMKMKMDGMEMNSGPTSRTSGIAAGESATTLIEASSEPGLPGVSHALHVGATGFFLDHAAHLRLTTEQAKQLAKIQQKSVLTKATYDRRIAEAEQSLWSRTGEENPSRDKIRAEIKAITDLGAERRMAFIQAVMDACEILTPPQHELLLGEVAHEGAAQPQKKAK